MRQYMAAVRAEAVAKLGGACKRCGFADPRALQIDHVHGDGWAELRNGANTFLHLKRVLADKANRYQLLCANCNWIKRAENGEQPHGVAKRQRNER